MKDFLMQSQLDSVGALNGLLIIILGQRITLFVSLPLLHVYRANLRKCEYTQAAQLWGCGSRPSEDVV
jgi:hypothetical protein